nr:Chain G, KaiC C-terminal peptide [synthetic construct]5C5E_H Chain H, KaiC C-terminal peptide [synthetic construct]
DEKSELSRIVRGVQEKGPES